MKVVTRLLVLTAKYANDSEIFECDRDATRIPILAR
jgi:hypothetical protein